MKTGNRISGSPERKAAGCSSPGDHNHAGRICVKAASFIFPAEQQLDDVCDDGAKQVRRDREGEVFKVHDTALPVSTRPA